MVSGVQGRYFWLSGQAEPIQKLLHRHPEVAVGKSLVIQSINRKPLAPSQLASYQEWTVGEHYLAGPRIRSVAEIPDDPVGHFTAWFVFSEPEISDRLQRDADLRQLLIALRPPPLGDPVEIGAEPGSLPSTGSVDDRTERLRQMHGPFWARIERLAPESCIFAGSPFFFVTQNAGLHAKVQAWVRECEAAEEVTAVRVLNMRDMAPGRECVRVSAGPEGSLVVLSSEQPLYQSERREYGGRTYHVRRPVDRPHQYRIHSWSGAGVEAVDLPETRVIFHSAQPLGRGLWLLAAESRQEEGPGNAHIYSVDGELVSRLNLGAGIEHVQTTADGYIWVGYNDEGIYKYGGLGTSGAACFDRDGKAVLQYAHLAKKHNMPHIDDCSAMNVASDHDVWLYYYMQFPLVRLRDRQFDHIWMDVPVRMSRGFAVAGDRVLFAGSHTYRGSLLEVELGSTRVRKLRPVSNSGDTVRFTRAFGRGARLYLSTAHEVFVVDVNFLAP